MSPSLDLSQPFHNQSHPSTNRGCTIHAMNTLFCGIKLPESHQIIPSKFPVPRNQLPPPQSLVSKAKVQSWACQISSQLWDQPPVNQLSSPLPSFRITKKSNSSETFTNPFASHLASSSLDSRFESTLSQPESPIYQPRLHDTCHEHPILRDQIAGISSNHIFQISRSKKSTSTTPKSCKQGQGTIMGLSDLEPALGSTSSEPAFQVHFPAFGSPKSQTRQKHSQTLCITSSII